MDFEEDIVAVFAANLRHYRKIKLNMTQEQFAAHCEFDRTYVSGLERQTPQSLGAYLAKACTVSGRGTLGTDQASGPS